jgi:polyhydroxyalkanoate synthesis regulator phasin
MECSLDDLVKHGGMTEGQARVFLVAQKKNAETVRKTKLRADARTFVNGLTSRSREDCLQNPDGTLSPLYAPEHL